MMECIKYISLKENKRIFLTFKAKTAYLRCVAYCVDTLSEVDLSVVEVSIMTNRQSGPDPRLFLQFGPLQ